MHAKKEQLVPTIDPDIVSDAALEQQLTYWRDRSQRDELGAQLFALLCELKTLR